MKSARPVKVILHFAAISGALVLCNGMALAADNEVDVVPPPSSQAVSLPDNVIASTMLSRDTDTLASDRLSGSMNRQGGGEIAENENSSYMLAEQPGTVVEETLDGAGASGSVVTGETLLQSESSHETFESLSAQRDVEDEPNSSTLLVSVPETVGSSGGSVITSIASTTRVASAITASQSRFFAIQPIIDSNLLLGGREAMGEALSAQASEHNLPLPSDSAATLGHLSKELALMIVPQLFGFHLDLPNGFVLTVASLFMALVLVVISLVLLFFTYGMWLKRGGFVTAARGDVSPILSLIAVRMFLDYVVSSRYLHNPFSVQQPIFYRREEVL